MRTKRMNVLRMTLLRRLGMTLSLACWSLAAPWVLAGPVAPGELFLVVLRTDSASIPSLRAQSGRGLSVRSTHKLALDAARDYAAQSQPKLLSRLADLEATGKLNIERRFWVANVIAVRCRADLLPLLESWPEVLRVVPNGMIATLPAVEPIREDQGRDPLDDIGASAALTEIRAPEAWALGLTGVGVLLANFDSGVNGSHPGLSPRWRGNQGYPAAQCWFDLVEPITQTPGDNDGHGTLTMGLQCGMFNGDTVGVAWNAQFISAAVAEGGLTLMNALEAFEWIIDPDGNPATFEDMPRVLSNSWGSSGGQDLCNSVLLPALDLCEAAGMAIVWSAGNEGPASGTLRSPAVRADNPVSGFAVGGWDGTLDSVWISSSRGPTPCTADSILRIKPELVAPSRDVRSTYLGTGFATSSGTSFSAPLAAGTLALMIEANPLLPPDSLLELLMLTAVDVAEPGLDNNSGYGRVDALMACQAALTGLGWVRGSVRDPFGAPLAASLQLVDHPHRTQTDALGEFALAHPAWTPITLQVVATGYQPQTIVTSVSPQGTTYLDLVLQPTQQGILTGNVIDCRGLPANGAFVSLLGEMISPTLTDANGRFLLTLNPGTYVVACSSATCDQTTIPDVQIIAGAITDIEIILPLNPAFLCSDADPFGYYLCDNNDPGGPTTTYLSVDPALGGRGVIHNLADDGTTSLALPFPVRFFGTDYQRVYVNTNGILSFLRSATAFNNLALPYNLTPALFPFWDDLSDNLGGNILSDYDPAQGTYTVEWANVPYYVNVPPPLDSLSFQVVFYDPAVRPSTSGNSVIEFRYGNVPLNSGATIGIDRAAGGGFVRYGYNGQWETHAVPVGQNVTVRVADDAPQAGVPSLSIEPGYLDLALAPGQSLDTVIFVRNLGSAPLAYSAHTSPPASQHVIYPLIEPTPLDWPKGMGPARVEGHDAPLLNWTPDTNGYAWGNSRTDTSIHYSFFDISGIGNNLELTRDDTISLPRPLPFAFPLYDRVFTTYGACTNGFLSFWSQARNYVNDPLALARDPYFTLAPFWTDLYPASGGQVWEYYDFTNDRFIVQWNDIVPYGFLPWETLTFQAVLYRNGNVDFVYEHMYAHAQLRTVGIKGGFPDDFLQLSYNGLLVDSLMTLRIVRADTAAASLQILAGHQGVVAPSATAAVELRITNNSAEQGLLQLPFYLESSAPDGGGVELQVSMQAGIPFDPQTVLRFTNDELKFYWRRHPSDSYALWNALPGDTLFTPVIPALSDTHVTITLPTDAVRFFVVTLAGAPAPVYQTGIAGQPNSKILATPLR